MDISVDQQSYFVSLLHVKAVMILNIGILYEPYKKYANVWCWLEREVNYYLFIAYRRNHRKKLINWGDNVDLMEN